MTEKDLLPTAILAGGLATRLRPLTTAMPKALIDVAGEPFVAHQLRLLSEQGVARVVICAGYLGEKIAECVGDGSRFGLRVDYSYDGPVLLGTAGALKKAAHLLGDAFFVMYGDSYLRCDFRSVQQAFVDSGRLALMTVFKNEGAWDASNVELVDDQIVAYDKKVHTPSMRHIDYGLGVLSQRALDLVPDGVPHDLALLYKVLLECGQLAPQEVRERFYEIGSPRGLDEARALLTRGNTRRSRVV